MTITRNRSGFDQEITFECDDCGEELHTDTPDFRSALAVMRREGWEANRDKDGDWQHTCPDCKTTNSAEEDFSL